MKSRTKIKKQAKRKRNPDLVETILKTKKEIAAILSMPRRRKICVNLDKIDKLSNEDDEVVVPGKVLGQGNLSKKVKVIAFSFSKEALEKLKKARCEVEWLKDAKLREGIKIIK